MVAHLSVARATDGVNPEPIGERYFTSLTIDAHLPDSYYSLLFVLVYLSKRGRAVARGYTDLAARAGIARSTASVTWHGLVDRGYTHPALHSVGGRPLRKVRCPRGGRNIRVSSFQMTALAEALPAGRLDGFHIRLLLWLVDTIAEDGPGGICGWRRSDMAKRLKVSCRRITEGVRALERAGLLRVHRGKRGRWTLTPLHAIPSAHPKPAAVLKAAHVARALAGDPRDPAAAIEAAAWAASRRDRRGTQPNTLRGTKPNTASAAGRTKPQVNAGKRDRPELVSSRGSSSVKTFSSVEGAPRMPYDRARERDPEFAAAWQAARGSHDPGTTGSADATT